MVSFDATADVLGDTLPDPLDVDAGPERDDARVDGYRAARPCCRPRRGARQALTELGSGVRRQLEAADRRLREIGGDRRARLLASLGAPSRHRARRGRPPARCCRSGSPRNAARAIPASDGESKPRPAPRRRGVSRTSNSGAFKPRVPMTTAAASRASLMVIPCMSRPPSWTGIGGRGEGQREDVR